MAKAMTMGPAMLLLLLWIVARVSVVAAAVAMPIRWIWPAYQMFSVENDGINCSILSSNEMHIFYTRFLSGTCTCTYTDKQANAYRNTFCLREKKFVLCIYWSKPMRRYEGKLSKNITLLLPCGDVGLVRHHISMHMLCKHMKRTNNCRYRRCRRRFQVAGCENNCSIFIMQHTNSGSLSLSLAHHTR